MKWSPGPTEADRRLLPEGRFAGPMPWVLAIMMFLTILAAAAGLALGGAARSLSSDLAGRLTVQIVEANPDRRQADAARLLREIGQMSSVESVSQVPEAEMKALLKPWLGEAGFDADLPVPVMLDVTMRAKGQRDIEAVKAVVGSVTPDARVDAQAQWLAPLSELLSSLTWLSVFLVALMAAAASAAVVLTARAALNTHRPTIEVMHLMGATDVQIARLFQRRIALDALLGGLVGLVAAGLVMLLLGGRLKAIGSDLLGSAEIGWIGWGILLSLPLLGTLLAIASARWTVLRALRKIL
jgi:cell division transport system permease protein